MSAASQEPADSQGAQRLSVEQLQAWQALDYGMFIHFGMSTFDGNEMSKGDQPSALYAPDQLDVDQWIQVARDAGMSYAVLTAKHVSGHCLWPTRHSDYQVGTSGNKTDVVNAFVAACDKHGIKAGLYYCSLDHHHQFGSLLPGDEPAGTQFYTTQAYRDFQAAQIEELLTQYGPIVETCIDIPRMLGHEGRRIQYDQIAALQPRTLIMMNNGFGDGTTLNYDFTWPTDLISIERSAPGRMSIHGGFKPWRTIAERAGQEKRYYVPGEVCDTIGEEWFSINDDRPRHVRELLGMRLLTAQRGANFLLNVPPDRHGVINQHYIQALTDLRRQYERLAHEGPFE